ncbi:hypothetical protein TNCT_172581 [Trichonephila clavata]|uniref:Uncharacterized protein n=1 Tax=Trichonephila clavata TaxID=2740835 RepID=A0A8X6K9P9_TRICU|nr:hypothetical protein TNCT_172581 [Trichonephila clavata]
MPERTSPSASPLPNTWPGPPPPSCWDGGNGMLFCLPITHRFLQGEGGVPSLFLLPLLLWKRMDDAGWSAEIK